MASAKCYRVVGSAGQPSGAAYEIGNGRSMTWPPEGLDVALAENAATAAIRQLAGVRMSWGEMIATAQSVQSNADDLEREEIGSLYESSTAAPLIAAARIFDSASDSGSGLPDAERISLAQLAVVSF